MDPSTRELFEELLDQFRDETGVDLEPFIEQLGALLMAGSTTDEEMRYSAILTLRK